MYVQKFVSGSLSSNINVFDIDQYKKEMTTHLKNKFEQANQDIKSGKVSGVEITGDSTKLANIFSEKSIDCVITSPPYYGVIKYSSGYKNEVGTKQTDIEYVRLLIKTFLPFLKSLKDDGNLIVNLATKKNQEYILNDFIQAMRAVGWELNYSIIWEKANPSPVSHDGVQMTHEYIYFFYKSGHKPRKYSILQKSASAGVKADKYPVRTNPSDFDKESSVQRISKASIVKKDKTVQSVWTLSNIKTSWNPRIRENLFDHHFGDSRTEINFENEVVHKKHQALMNPVVIRNCLWMTTVAGDIVVDPFSGAGTVTQMSKMMGRIGIGIELNKTNSMTAVIGRNFMTSGPDWRKYTIKDSSKKPKVVAVSQDSPLLSIPLTREQASKKTMYIDADGFRYSGYPFYYDAKSDKIERKSDRVSEILKGM